MEDKEPSPQKENVFSKSEAFWSKDTLDILFKIPVALVGLFYVSGIFVQGLYYGRLGINTLNLFKLSYILSGFWAVFVIILPAFLMCFSAFLLLKPDHLRRHYKTKYPRITDTIIRFGIVLLVFGIYLLVTQSIFPFLVKNYSDLFQIIWLAGLFSMIAVLSFLSVRIVLQKIQKLKVPLLILYTLVLICIYVGCIESFSRTIYLNIPAHLGGGNPISVNIIFKSGEKEISLLESEMNLRFERNTDPRQDKKNDESDAYAANVFLLTETDAGFYIKTESNKIIFLQRDSILHITYFETVF